MRKSLFTKSIFLVICLAFLAVLPPATGELLGKNTPTAAQTGTFGPSGHPRPTLDMVELQLPR